MNSPLRDAFRPTTRLAGPVGVASLGLGRRLVLVLACLVAYAAAAAVLDAMPTLFAPRP